MHYLILLFIFISNTVWGDSIHPSTVVNNVDISVLDTMEFETEYTFNWGSGEVGNYDLVFNNECRDTYKIVADIGTVTVPDKFIFFDENGDTILITPWIGSNATFKGFGMITPDTFYQIPDSLIPSDYHWYTVWSESLYRVEFYITSNIFNVGLIANQNTSTAFSIYFHEPQFISKNIPIYYSTDVTCNPDLIGIDTFMYGIDCDTMELVEYFLDLDIGIDLSYDTCVDQYEFITLYANPNLTNFMFDGMPSNSIEFYLMDDTQVFISGETDEGCLVTGTINIRANKANIFIPNTFSPNNDGINDYFEIHTKFKYRTAELLIYSRWGELVHRAKSSNAHSIRWDGGDYSNGVFAYVLKITKNNGKESLLSGDVTILK